MNGRQSDADTDDRAFSTYRQKAASVPIWIWIVGGLAIALLVLTGAYMQLMSMGEQAAKQQAIDQYNSLNEEARFLCQQAPGSQTTQRVSIGPGVLAMFASETRDEAPARVPQYIAEGEVASGEHICLTFEDEHYGCTEQRCQINMTYVGEPLEGTDMYEIGSGDGRFTFDLSIARERDSVVSIEASHVP